VEDHEAPSAVAAANVVRDDARDAIARFDTVSLQPFS
jgi:hypothetical protein